VRMLRLFIKSFMYGNIITVVLRISMGVLFLFSGAVKIIDPGTFARVIIQYDIIPEVLVPYPAIVLPVLEIMLGGMLVAGYRIRASSLISMALMLMFSIFITVNVVRGQNFDCGCFELNRIGIGINENISVKLVLRDLVMLAIFAAVYQARRHLFSVDSIIEKKRLRQI